MIKTGKEKCVEVTKSEINERVDELKDQVFLILFKKSRYKRIIPKGIESSS